MDQFGTWVAHHVGWLWIALAAVTLVLAAIVVNLAAKLARLKRDWAALMSGTNGANLEQQLAEHLRARMQTDDRIARTESNVETLQMKMASSKRYLGMVKFDAFEDVGGQQSFALAFYDELGDGVVLSNLVGRADSRIYCKEIRSGKADRDLSREESQAIELAAKNRAEAASRG